MRAYKIAHTHSTRFRIILLTVILLLSACRKSEAPVTARRFLLGTYVNITSYDADLSPAVRRTAIDSAMNTIARLERLTNPYDTTSVVGRLNHHSDRERKVVLPLPLAKMIRQALAVAQSTGGAFDITLWKVFKLWHFGTDSATVPPDAAIQNARLYVDWHQAQLDSANQVTLPAGVEIDLGGIHKGFAVEQARRVLLRRGLQNFIIDAGGNLAIEWHRPDSVQVLVRHPRRDGKFWGYFPVGKSCGIATSGDYQFYIMQNGKRYHHILNPRTGYPAQGAVSVTIIAPNAALADGYSTAVFVMGHEAGMRFIETRPELEGMVIYNEPGVGLKTLLSTGLKSKFILSEDAHTP